MKCKSLGFVIALMLASAVAMAQGVWSQLGLKESDARSVAEQVLDGGGPNHLRTYDPIVLRMKESWYKLPAASRGPAMTAIYAWTKSHVSAPAFRAAYTQTRNSQKPALAAQAGTVDQELKAKLAQQAEEQEASFKMLEANGMKAQADRQRKQYAEMQAKLVAAHRAEIEERRAKEKADIDQATREWEARFPPELNVFIARHLREFLNATGDVDYSAKLVRSPVDGSMQLADPALRRDKPWQWQEAVHYGPEAIAAARRAASAWLKELEK